MSIVSQVFLLVQQASSAFSRRRRQRLALAEMLQLGPARLEALGVDAFAVREALQRDGRVVVVEARAAKPVCEHGFARHA
jgi:hypothetical protein